jgi:hypothetical protein
VKRIRMLSIGRVTIEFFPGWKKIKQRRISFVHLPMILWKISTAIWNLLLVSPSKKSVPWFRQKKIHTIYWALLISEDTFWIEKSYRSCRRIFLNYLPLLIPWIMTPIIVLRSGQDGDTNIIHPVDGVNFFLPKPRYRFLRRGY